MRQYVSEHLNRLIWSYAGHETLGDHMATRVVSGHTARKHRLIWSYAGHETLGDHMAARVVSGHTARMPG
ncbi:hypothetical protein DPMN_074622 [Dreissena polymorpha]|uniref:Uncharacterized protein n=1 Tax=Dreissena polymorpha TaxID=45954 RepID=A0A9D4BNK5_DREPO|nr:hypothetical protein DPMN_074622 [Dreissena polymorpha]